jgi:ribosomal protein L16/L10AE
MQKNRNKKKIKIPNLRFGNVGLMFSHEGSLEIKQLLIVRRFLKKKLRRRDKKKKKIRFWSRSHKAVWLYLVPNFIISKKSKNSRMGKGKGLFLKWVIRVKTGFVFLELNKIHPKKVFNVISRLVRLLKVKVSVIKKEATEYSLSTHSCYKFQYYGQSIYL